jgi:tetratricopeptide (TPR) repeat protein
MQSGDLEQASRQFYQYQYHHPDSERADRPLAWTLFRLGECQKSLALYQRIIARHATATDYINAGHVALAQNDIREAVNYYRLALASMTVEQLSKAISDDAEYLQQAGVSSHTLGMLHDAIQYTT